MAESIVLDTHFHIWELDRFNYRYPSVDQPTINKDILIDEYETELSTTPITQGIFVQVAHNDAVAEAEWIIDLANKSKRNAIVGLVAGFKLNDPNLDGILERFSDEKLFLGVRNILEFEPDPVGYLLKDDTLRGFSKLVDRKIPFCLLSMSKETREPLRQLVKLFPEHPCVLDHLGNPKKAGTWDRWISELARYPNVFCKLSSQFFEDGPLTPAQKAGKFSDDDRKWINRCLELFGVDRCMFGSDWPVCTLSGITSIKELYGVADNLLSHLTAEERNKIFRGNAVKFFNLEDGC